MSSRVISHGNVWWRCPGLNGRPAAYESAALPTELHRQNLVYCILAKAASIEWALEGLTINNLKALPKVTPKDYVEDGEKIAFPSAVWPTKNGKTIGKGNVCVLPQACGSCYSQRSYFYVEPPAAK